MTDFNNLVLDEQERQLAKFGEQNHEDYTPNAGPFITNRTLANAEAVKQVTDEKFQRGCGSWNDILVEEAAEAQEVAELGDLENLKAELVQVAAVAKSWYEAIERRQTAAVEAQAEAEAERIAAKIAEDAMRAEEIQQARELLMDAGFYIVSPSLGRALR